MQTGTTAAGGNPGQIIEVAAGLVFRSARLLITQRRAGDHLGGLWEFPGGKRQPDESFEDCLHRELAEELGIQVTIERCLETIDHDYPGRRVHLRFFRCLWRAHEPRPLECQAFAWVEQLELRQYTFPAADEQLLARLTQSREWWDPR